MSKPSLPRFSRRNFLEGTGAVAVALGTLPRRGWGAEEKIVNVYNWDTYIGDTTLDDFTDKTGIEVRYDLYANNEELFAKLKEGNPGYDVIFPSDYMIETMLAVDLLEPLDHSKLSNFENIDPNFRNPAFDPGLAHNVPYMWGTIGIGYRKSKVQTPTSWGDILDSDKYSGRIALLADQRAVLGLALKYLGYSMNSTTESEVHAARDLIIKQKPHLKAFAPDEGQNMLIAGDVDIVMEWNGDILAVIEEDDDLSYVVPNEGTMVWMDGVAIPKGAPHPENAHAFIDFLMDAEVNAAIANTIHYATGNAAARQYVDVEDLANPAIYTPDDVVAKSESLVDVGDHARLYDEAWTAIQAA